MTTYLGNGNDTYDRTATHQLDVAHGLKGDDLIATEGDGNDLMTGGHGCDVLCGGSGFDTIDSVDGNDGIRGNENGGSLSGGNGDD